MQLNQPAKPLGINGAWWLLGLILVVNLVQSIFSPLLNDEPYYWLYAQYPSWGYFDHPPMVAFLIKLGGSLFAGEIGVRLLSAVLGSLTFFLLYKLIEGETGKPINFKLAALLLLSSLFLNLYSFLAIPDTPMLFFGVLFLYAYRRYLKADDFLNALILGVVTALLLYSKYHGILLVGFTVLSNIRLVLKRSFYLVFIVAIVLYIPHIYWEFQNDFPTIRFQFTGRVNAFNIQHVLSYLGEQAAVTGPLFLLVFSILYRPENQFQKALKYNVIGVFIFFLFSSFKEMVNVHWTAIAFPGMLCLAYLYIEKLRSGKKIIWGLLVFNLAIVLFFRVNMIFNIFPVSNFNDRNPRVMASVLKARSNGYPLVFADMYNDPSYYRFYTHDDCFAVNNVWYKKTQYNYLPGLEQQFQDKTVSYVSYGAINPSSQKVTIPKGKTYYITTLPGFVSFNNIKVDVVKAADLKASAEGTIPITITNKLTAQQQQFFKRKGAYLVLTLINNKTQAPFYFKYDKPLDINSTKPLDFRFKAPAEKGEYHYIFSMVTPGHISTGFNSNIYNCRIE
ncbi:glycosyltransferase family 39 protein [Mucilaginibacter corticis]|uniref:Glycosyltransferase family 39 protein n=1 Tax=Mucilaginibacter corticis TaxID=2597670 RepID=A0A556MW21_9SPHI|nr:glycosyltransferase family 39 protein [Mucilaginibacter corticis]TSJ44008.1 glycosyltransferase family 39 protein [Mucilaginibacter corticis]